VSRALTVRDRVVPRAEPPYERLFDPLVDDLVHGGELSRARFASYWSDTQALAALAAAKRRPLPGPLAQAMRTWHEARGASRATLANLDRLARGEAVCVVAGQQPAPLGGPLYALHKTACAVGLANAVTERIGVPCVPLFWMHGEDSDFLEIHSATLATSALELKDVVISPAAHPEGGLVGGIPVRALLEAELQGLPAWDGLSGAEEARALVTGAAARAADLGEAHSALMLALFGTHGLVVADPRLPAFRAEARVIIDRYLAQAEALSAAARAAGDRLERALGRRPLADASLDSFVFEIQDGTRHKITPAEARAAGPKVTLSPSVALRPVVQDGVFPTVAMACGAAEISYLAQLREVFEGVGVRAACPVPRLGATWLPPAAIELIEAAGVPAWEVVTAADRVVREHAERAVPAALRTEFEATRTGTFTALDRLAAASTQLDASLPQLVESVRGKIDFQFARLLEALTSKARHRLERQHPEWMRLRYFLLPGDRLQERRLCSLEPVAYGGLGRVDELCAIAGEQARRLAGGVHEHLLLEL
jgi:bacillithiol synthase